MWTSIKELFSLPKFDNSSLSVTRGKEICKGMKNWVPQLINRHQRLNLLFLSVARFFELCEKKYSL